MKRVLACMLVVACAAPAQRAADTPTTKGCLQFVVTHLAGRTSSTDTLWSPNDDADSVFVVLSDVPDSSSGNVVIDVATARVDLADTTQPARSLFREWQRRRLSRVADLEQIEGGRLLVLLHPRTMAAALAADAGSEQLVGVRVRFDAASMRCEGRLTTLPGS